MKDVSVNQCFAQDRAFCKFPLYYPVCFKHVQHGALVSSPDIGYILLAAFVFMFLFN